MARRDPSKADYWRWMIGLQAGSGLSVRAWCGQHDVSEASFYCIRPVNRVGQNWVQIVVGRVKIGHLWAG